MILIDSLIAGGLRFVLDKIARAADGELFDPARVHEELLEAQMRLELGELTQEEYRIVEEALLARLREIKEARGDEG